METAVGPVVDPVHSDDRLPERTSVVVVGGGIAGSSTALYLAEKGISVVLCEKGHIAGEQSSRNWGWVTARGRDMRELPLCLESARLWKGMNEFLGTETGYRRLGSLRVYDTEENLAIGEEWLKEAQLLQIQAKFLQRGEIEELAPGASRQFKGALYAPDDGRAEPQKAAPAIAEGARRRGAKIFTQCAVRGVDIQAGKVAGVVTERGRIACDAIVLAGGGWSTVFCGNLNIRLPQMLVQASAMRTEPMDGPVGPTIYADKFSLRKRLDGGYNIGDPFHTKTEITPDSFRYAYDYLPMLQKSWKRLRPKFGSRALREWRRSRHWSLDQVSPFEKLRVLDPPATDLFLNRAQRSLVETFPAFAQARIAQRWAGLIDITPDAVPVISKVDALPGLFLNTGFSGHGFGLGPGAGKLMADIVADDAPIVDPTPFRYSRFIDGSRPKPKAGF